MSISIRLVTVIGVLEVTEVFLTSEIGTIAQRAESSGAFFFSLGRKSIPTALQEVRKIPPVLIPRIDLKRKRMLINQHSF